MTFRVTFSEDVELADAADFSVTGATTAAATSTTVVAGNAAQYVVTVGGGSLANYEGEVGLAFAAGQNVEDLAGNALDATLPSGNSYETYTLDNTAPAVVSVERDDGAGNDPGRLTSADTLTFRVTFSEGVENAGTADFAVTGATTAAATSTTVVAGNAAQYVVTVGGGSLAGYNGTVGLIFSSGQDIQDSVGHALNATLPTGNSYETYILDNTAPTVVSVERGIGSTIDVDQFHQAGPTGLSLAFRVTFSEDVQNVDKADFTFTAAGVTPATEASVRGIWGNAAQYIVTVGGAELGGYEGDVGLAFTSGQDIEDRVGQALANTTPTGANEIYTLDNTGPTPTLGGPPLHFGKDTFDGMGRFEVTVTFDEAVNGFAAGDITVNGGTKSNFTGSDGDSRYTVTVTPGGIDDVTVSVAAGAATDLAGNTSVAAQDLTVPWGQAPGLTIANATAEEGEALEFTVTVNLRSGAMPGAFTVTVGYENGSATAGADFTATAHMIDFAGTDGESHKFTVATIEDAMVEGSETFTVALSSRNVTLAFGTGTITDDDEAGATVTPTSVSMNEGGSADYTLALTSEPTAEVTIAVARATGGDTDLTAAPASLTFSASNWSTAQTVTVSAAENDADFVVDRATFTHTASSTDTNYGASLVLPSVAASAADNDSSDTTAPTVMSIERDDGAGSDPGRLTNADTLTFRVTFSEDVELVNAADFAVTGATTAAATSATVVTGSDAQYLVTVGGGTLASYDGKVGLTFASGHNIVDPVGHVLDTTLPTGNSYETYTLDNTAPTVISVTRDPGTGVDPGRFHSDTGFGLILAFRVAFSEDVENVDTADFTYTAAGVTPTTALLAYKASGNSAQYIVTLGAPQGYEGDMGLAFTSGQDIKDKAGNALNANLPTGNSYQVYTKDDTVPTVVSITRDPGTGVDPGQFLRTDPHVIFPAFRVTFSEDVRDVDKADFTFTATGVTPTTEAAVRAVSGNAAQYIVTVGGPELGGYEGDVGLVFTSGQDIEDRAAHALDTTLPTGANYQIYTLDGTAPTVTSIERDSGSGTDPGQFHQTSPSVAAFRVTFSEDVAKVGTADFAVSGATTTAVSRVDAVSGNAAQYLVALGTVAPADYEGDVGLLFASGQDIEDRVRHALDPTLPTGANYEIYTLDSSGPTVTLARADGLDTTLPAGAFDVTVTFTEANGLQTSGGGAFAASDLSVTNGSPTVTATSDPLVWTARITPDSDVTGNVTVELPANGVKDLAGNGNTAADPLNVPVETVAPTVASIERHDGMEALDTLTNADTLTFLVTFSEDVENVDAADFDATGTTGDASSVDPVTGNAAQYIVTVEGGDLADYDGEVGLAFASEQDIADAVGNALADTTPSGANQKYLLDNTPPRVASVKRDDGNGNDPGEITNADSLQFRVTFSEPVGEAGVADFAVTGTTAGMWLPAPPTATEIKLNVNAGDLADYNGEVALIFDTDNLNIEDALGHPLDTTLPTDDDYQVYTVDNVAPTVLTIERHNGTEPQPRLTDADSITFRVTFSEAMTNINPSDFDLTGTRVDSSIYPTGVSSATALPGGRSSYVITVASAGLADYNGELGLHFPQDRDMTDLAGNPVGLPLPSGENWETYLIDNAAPTVASVERHDGTDAQPEFTRADSLTFRVTFSEDVENVDKNDFDASGTTGDASTVSPVTDNAAQYIVTVEGGDLATYEGQVGLTLATRQDIVDALDYALDPATPPPGPNYQTYTVDHTAPTAVSVERHDGTDAQAKHTNADTISFRVTFSEAAAKIDAADFDASGTAGDASAAQPVPGNDTQYVVTVIGGDLAAYNGEVGLTFSMDQDIADLAGNPLDIALPTGENYEKYILDNIKPAVVSIERHDGTDAQHQHTSADSLTFRVTFNEDVESVDVDDFEATASTGVAGGALPVAGNAAHYVVTLQGGNLSRWTGEVGLEFASGQDIVDLAGNLLDPALPTGEDYETYTLNNTRWSWNADLVVTLANAGWTAGYCTGDCADRGDIRIAGMTGSLVDDGGDNAFTILGSNAGVTVTLLAFEMDIFELKPSGLDLFVRLAPDDRWSRAIAQGWFVTVGDVERSLSGATHAGDGILRLDDFFTLENWPMTVGTQTVEVCFRSQNGDCALTHGTVGASSAMEYGLAARFGAAPAWHTGMAFWTAVHFSAEPSLGHEDVRDKLFEVTGGRILRAQPVEQGSNDGWRLEVLPEGFDDVTLALPATDSCETEGAVCTAEGARLETGATLTVPGPGERLAAKLANFPTRHDGQPFEPELRFSREPDLSSQDVRDTLFAVTGGRITGAQRLEQDSNRLWKLVVEPAGTGDLTIELPATQDCSVEGAVCAHDGKMLTRGFSVTIEGVTAFSVSDAETTEAPGASLAFEVSLNRPRSAETRVDVSTRDGTAQAGSDYEAVSRTLVFAPGEILKTVEVRVLDDAHDEGSETMMLVLSNASGARVADAEGTGTIANSDAIPRAWMARFGRTVTGQVLDAVEQRLAAPRQASMQATLAGRALPLSDNGAVANSAALWTLGARAAAPNATSSPTAWVDQDAPLHLRGSTLSSQEVLAGTNFTLTAPAGERDNAYVSLWGRGMVSGFDGSDDGLTLDGRVTTSLLGVDWATERWTAGLSFGHSAGAGGYRRSDCGADPEACGGTIEATLNGLYPYAGLRLSERLSLWLAAGLGAGQLTVHPHGVGAQATDLALGMGAAGLRSEVPGLADGAGLRLALKGDARFTRMWSDAVSGPDGNLAAADADVWLVRAGIEGSRRFALGSAASLTPSLEIGLRRDGGDAEVGFGADVGVGLTLDNAQRGLRLDLRIKMLAAHESTDFREWGASAALSFDPRPATDQGLSMSLRQAWGATPSGGMEALLRRESLSGLASPGVGRAAGGRLEGEVGYGVPMFGGALTGRPNAGIGVSETNRDFRLGWRFTPSAAGPARFELNLDATRRESSRPPGAEHGVSLSGSAHW